MVGIQSKRNTKYTILHKRLSGLLVGNCCIILTG